MSDDEGWTRVDIRAERLDWVPGMLATLDADLVVESSNELHGLLLALAQRLLTASSDQGRAGATPPANHTGPGLLLGHRADGNAMHVEV